MVLELQVYGSEGDKTLTWDGSNSETGIRVQMSMLLDSMRDTFIGNLEGALNSLVTRVDQPNITSLGDLTGLGCFWYFEALETIKLR